MKINIKNINKLTIKVTHKKYKNLFLFIRYKFLILYFLIILILKYINIIQINNLKLNENYLNIQNNLNLSFINKITNKIKIAIYGYSIKNGGRARMTALLVNYYYKIKIFNIYLFTKVKKEDNEYRIPVILKRIVIKNDIIKILKKNKIDILIYELDDVKEINILNDLNNIKVIFYHHSSSFDWIYDNYSNFKVIYKAFRKSKFFISIVPFENDYLFKKWGIRSIFINDFITVKYNSIIPSDLALKKILMIGRGKAKKKRFHIGIHAMGYIMKEFKDSELQIISNLTGINDLITLVYNLNLENNVNFLGYSSTPEIYLKNASLNIFPSISESFGLVLCETKTYGIPNIIIGLDYLSISKGGTIIIYDDTPESLAKVSINILKNDYNKKKLGVEARKSIKKFNNEILFDKWLKVTISIINGERFYIELREKEEKGYENEIRNILNNQIMLLKKRIFRFNNISIYDYINFTFMETINLF